MLFPHIPEVFADLTDAAIARFIEETTEVISRVGAAPTEFVTDDLSATELLAQMRASMAAVHEARAVLATREAEATSAETLEAEAAEIARLAQEGDEQPEAETTEAETTEAETPEAETAEVETPVEEAAVEVETPEVETPVVAAGTRLMRPARSSRATPADTEEGRHEVALTAAAGGFGFDIGDQLPGMSAVGQMMIARRKQFGTVPEGTRGERIPIARADWSDLYPDDRTLGTDEEHNATLVAAALVEEDMIARLAHRREEGLTASGGLCAPVTPYYQLQMLAVADRPVRAALPAFNADRGGIRYAAPAGLGDITTGIGVVTAAQDAAGGSSATKNCQRVVCPPFSETDIEAIYHCLEFGNFGARTFPELLAQWTGLTMAAHARLAETGLLTGIDAFSTQVVAGNMGLGASASFFGQILAAANGLRNRNRMRGDAVLRLLLPAWSVDMIVSDVIRTQFQRFDTDAAKVTALLRTFNVEPTFYIDGAAGKGQVFGPQGDGVLIPFPDEVVAYLYPEGSFLYLDGGTLELGLVRDSVLNATNDFQIFGETFENVAFVGIEALAITAEICDNGAVSAPNDVSCPITYGT